LRRDLKGSFNSLEDHEVHNCEYRAEQLRPRDRHDLLSTRPARRGAQGKESSRGATMINAIGFAGGNRTLLGLLALLILFLALMVGIFVYTTGQSNDQRTLLTLATQQQLLSQQLARAAGDAADGRDAAFAQLAQLRAEFDRTVATLKQGNSQLGIAAAPAALQPTVDEVAERWQTYRNHVNVIVNGREAVQSLPQSAPEVREVEDAAEAVEAASDELLANTSALEQRIARYGSRLDVFLIAAVVFGALAVAVLIAIGYLFNQETQHRLEVSAEQNRRNQRAILRLLDEMTNLADGDLTVHATVTEDITGAIADSVNYSIDALRSLVATINQTAEQVATSAERTQTTALRLADASRHQAREIAAASAAITTMAGSIEQVSRNAGASAEVAQKSVQIANKGAQTVSRTIQGMNVIREQIQETSKRIKRLGESSQEIGDIVSLIDEIADQTNILALNAAIQASTAGEAGRGFAVVADEVQRLSERAGNATKQIEALVKTIQTDTNEAVISMEQSTANVVAGAKQAEDAGEALTEIETVSSQLARLIQSISRAAREQAAAAAQVTSTMKVIEQITTQTSEGSRDTANSIGNLTGLASELRRSVAGFKLPEEGATDEFLVAERQARI
jgi:twitching motility protein PilJ